MTKPHTQFEALQAAVEKAGSQSELARICGVGQPAVWKWLRTSRRMPAEHVIAAETATGISRHLLRPDIYPLPLPREDEEPGEDCGPILASNAPAVSANPQSEVTPLEVNRAAR